MKKTDITRVTVKSGEEPPRGETDWAAVSAMTDEEVLAAALSDPDAQPLDSEALAKMRRVSPVKVAAAARHDSSRVRGSLPAARQHPAGLGAAPQHSRCTRPRVAASDRPRARDDATSVVSGGLKTYPERPHPYR